jgi:tRNA(His) 5'-end guanylyltransferase
MPVIIRIDGVHFSTFTKGMEKPVDLRLKHSMIYTMFELCKKIQGCKFGYAQSDEISLLLTDYDNFETAAWFDNCLRKIVSVSASLATMYFNKVFGQDIEDVELYIRKRDTAYFDARAFNLTKEEVNNYFVWRQQDCIRNSIQALGQSKFSNKQLDNVNCLNIKTMLKEVHGIDWDEIPLEQQRGTCTFRIPADDEGRKKWNIDDKIPMFSEDRNYIEQFL